MPTQLEIRSKRFFRYEPVVYVECVRLVLWKYWIISTMCTKFEWDAAIKCFVYMHVDVFERKL